MHVITLCLIALFTLTVLLQGTQGIENVDKKVVKRANTTQDGEQENASIRAAIPGYRHRKRGPRHRRHHVLSRHDRRALRHRYNSVLAIGVGLGVAGGWICIATVVYVVRYMRAKGLEKKAMQAAELL